MVYQDVTRNKNITAAAKGLYAYLSSFCGKTDECYPSIETIIREMAMGRDTFYRHINALVAAGVVEKRQTVNDSGKFGRTVYRLTHEVVISDLPFTQNEDADLSITEDKATNNNSINNNSINNNSIIGSEPDKSAPNQSGILIPLNDKTLYDVPLDKVALWKESYPAVDVEQELRKMAAWSHSNPTRRKTRRGVDRFINAWLSKEQDKGGSRPQKGGDPVGTNNKSRGQAADFYEQFLGAGDSD